MLRNGQVFAGYTVEGLLGRGGMGSVYLARHPRLPRRIALKLLNQELFADSEIRARFEREADLAAQLDHANIVTVFDRGIEDEQLWISMQYIDGVDGDSIDVRALEPAQAVRIIAETARALDFAHRRGVLHRDVKPANILVERSDDPGPARVLLTDFGIARLLNDTGRLTRTGTFVATLAYASPELLSGANIGHQTDQYSLACSLFRLLTGTGPFDATNPVALIQGHMQSPPPLLSAIRPGLPHELDAILVRAMAKRVEDRYGSCGEFADAAVAAFAGPVSVPAPPPAPSPPTVVLPTPPGPQLWFPTPAPARALPAVPNRLAMTGKSGLGFGVCVRAIAFDPGGRVLTSIDSVDKVRRWDLTTDATTTKSLAGSHDPIAVAAFFPDGRQLVTGGGGTAQVWDSTTGRPADAAFVGHNRWVWAVACSRDGGRVATASADQTVRIWAVATGAQIGDAAALRTSQAAGALAFSPDGRYLACGSSADEVRLLDTHTCRIVWSSRSTDAVPANSAVVSVAFSPDGRVVAAGSSDGSLRFWDLPRGRLIGSAAGEHHKTIHSLAFRADGTLLATGSADKTVRFWDPTTGKEIGQALTALSPIWSVAFSPDGGSLAVAAGKSVQVWK
ncbi:WD40 repeat domain-containing serine/threonine protein kinase [Nocardia sp. NPDC052566]|uniref:WD40 repeat domain-containing serine/threonine protein kinase n=1 Tax=Nocardia sp. NPDC052566 TaxID=3364330 RepID=UPI0037C75622